MWGRRRKPDIDRLSSAFGVMLDTLDEWRGSGLTESVLLTSCLERAWDFFDLGPQYGAPGREPGLPEWARGAPEMTRRYEDALTKFMYNVAANTCSYQSIEINLLVSINDAIGNRPLSGEEVEMVVVRNAQRWQPPKEPTGG